MTPGGLALRSLRLDSINELRQHSKISGGDWSASFVEDYKQGQGTQERFAAR